MFRALIFKVDHMAWQCPLSGTVCHV